MHALADQVILITGASAGLGRALALRCAAAGARLALTARTPATLEAAAAAAAEVAGGRDRVVALPADVQDSAAVGRLVDATLSAFGHIDVLVNNAGFNRRAAVAELGEAVWDQILGTNLKGPFVCTRAVLPHMLARGSGRIVFVSTVMAFRGYLGHAAYCASKAGLNIFADSLRAEVEDQGVRVQVFCPGLIRTDFAGRPAAQKTGGMEPDSAAAVLFNQITAPADTLADLVTLRPWADAAPSAREAAPTMPVRLEVYVPFRGRRVWKSEEQVPAGVSPATLLRSLGLESAGDLTVLVNGRYHAADQPIPPGAEVAVLRRSEGG